MQDYSGYGQPPAGDYGPTMPMPPMPPRPPRRRIGALSYLLVALAAGALGAGSVVALYHPASNDTSTAVPQPSSSALNPAPLPSSAAPLPISGGPSTSAGEQAVVNKVAPGLVIINTTLQYNGEQAAATGMVLTSTGEVLTNNHVIEDSTSITARTANGHKYQAKVVGYDVTGDIAVIQLQGASGLTTVPVGHSSTVKTGDSVVALGNAEGQSAIVPATGQVTALNQTITAGDQGGSVTQETLHNMIQTNANIVSGDSGGPLANTAGQVIGMDTAGNDGGFAVQQDSSGYAIPIDTAVAVAQQIVQGQASSTITIGYPPFMGIYIGQGSNSDPQAQAEAEQQGGGNGFGGNGFGGFGGNGNQNCYTSDRNLTAPQNIANVSSGTLILGTICSGPAMAAGMTAGSVITAVNGQAIGSPDSLTGVVSKFRPGTTIKVTWVSPSGRRTTSSINLTAGPPL
ncbi:MAG: S1C family serine protease [Streptosporangiaceae bacterium]